MTILFAGTSLADVSEISGSPTTHLITADLDTYVSEGILCPLGLANFFTVKFAPQSELWVSFYALWYATAGGANDGVIFSSSSFNGDLFKFDGVGNSATGALSYHDGTSLQGDVVTGGDYAGKHRVDIHIKMADTGGIFRVYKDGVLDMDLSSVTTDTVRTAATTIDRIIFRAISLSLTVYSGIIVANEDTRGLRLNQQLPNGSGATSDWSGAYTAIDETGINDGDSISSDTIGEVSTFSFPAAHSDFNTAAWAVKAVVASVRAVSTPAGDIDVAGVVRTASTNYESAALNVAPAYNAYQVIWETNPNTAVDWTFSEASGSQVGVKTVA